MSQDSKRLLRGSRVAVHRGTLRGSSAFAAQSRKAVNQRKAHGDTARTTKRLLENSRVLMEQTRGLTEQTDALAETHHALMRELKRRHKTRK